MDRSWSFKRRRKGLLTTRAYDRAARHFRLPKAAFNFPADSLPAAEPSVLLGEARRQGKRVRSSRQIGVSWMSNLQNWRPLVPYHWRSIHLGLPSDARRVAQAYGARAIALRDSRVKIDCHPDTGRVVNVHRVGDLPSFGRVRCPRGFGKPHRPALERPSASMRSSEASPSALLPFLGAGLHKEWRRSEAVFAERWGSRVQ